MREHLKRFAAMLVLSWLGSAATVTLALGSYAAEDFSLTDLIPIYLILVVFGFLLTAVVAFPVMLLLCRRFVRRRGVILYPLIAALLIASPVAAATSAAVFIFGSMPAGEAILFTAAFVVSGLTFGLAFFTSYGEGWTRHWTTWLACMLLAAGAVPATVFFIPLVEEALLANAANGSVVPVATMSEPRSAHTATLLPDGRVLLIGGMVSVRGDEVSTASTEFYDPRTGTFAKGAKMTVPRAGHTATLLPDGNVLVTGGGDGKTMTTAELYQPASGQFVSVGPMLVSRERHAATLLIDGRVHITGGTAIQPSNAAEIYDAKIRGFIAIAPMQARRFAHSSTLMRDGRVLIAGGAESLDSVLKSVELYDPGQNTFKSAGQLQASRYKHSAVLLSDDKVMLLGGSDERDWGGRRQSVEVYNATNHLSQLLSPMNRSRFKFPNAVTITTNGDVVVGGAGRRVEVYARSANRFTVSDGSLGDEWFYATATSLQDGRVFIAGGYNDSLEPTNQAWTYVPVASRPKLAWTSIAGGVGRR
jgi:hypothetical protein